MFTLQLLKQLEDKPLSVAVVGHVNVGKTATLQTLCHDPGSPFTPANRPGNTVEPVDWALKCERTAVPYAILRDTPGLQYATQALQDVGNKLDFTVAEVRDALISRGRTADVKALDAAMRSDYLLYVIDVTIPPDQGRIDEFHIFRKIRPMIALFNFVVVDNHYKEDWDSLLSEHGMFFTCEYDAHSFHIKHEKVLYQKLRAQARCELHEQVLAAHQATMDAKWHRRTSASRDAIERLLTKTVTTLVLAKSHVSRDGERARQVADELRDNLEQGLAEAEAECYKAILNAHDVPSHRITMQTGETTTEDRSDDELFSKKWWKWQAGGIGAGAVTGATIGGTIDAFVGGASFGLGLGMGAVLGAAIGVAGGRSLQVVYDGEAKTVTVFLSDEVIRQLLGRALHLLYRVQRRGLADKASDFVVGDPREMIEKLQSDECEEASQALLEHLHECPDNPRARKPWRYLLPSRREAAMSRWRSGLEAKLRAVVKHVGIWP